MEATDSRKGDAVGLELLEAGVIHSWPGRLFSARSNRAWTSASVVCSKSSYQRPTASNGSGVRKQTTSSASARSSCHVEGAPTGTATTLVRGDIARRALAAARTVH